jgi:hypothetical protein
MKNTTSIDIKEIPSALTEVKAPSLMTFIVSKELDNLPATRKLVDAAFLNVAGDIAIIHPEGNEMIEDLIESIGGDDEGSKAKVLVIDTVYRADEPDKTFPTRTADSLSLFALTQGIQVVFLTERLSAAIERGSFAIAEVIPGKDGDYLLNVSKHRRAKTGSYPFSL